MDKSTITAEHYFTKDPEEERFYDIFFMLCRKYNVSWTSAGDKEKAFIEEITRVTYELDRAKRLGRPRTDIRGAFVS